MKEYETPFDFETKYDDDSCHIRYENLSEISQGGPIVGSLYINDKLVSQDLFCGPYIATVDYLFVPILVGKTIGNGFKLCKIKLNTLDIRTIGDINDIVIINEVSGNRIIYFTDIQKTKRKEEYL